jgi:hypothetical protein
MFTNSSGVFTKFLTGIMLLLISGAGYGQSAERAMNSLQKKRWPKAKDQLDKAIEKDSLDPAVYYVYALFYFTPGNPAYHIDSAYRSTVTSLQYYTMLPSRERDKLKRFPLDSMILTTLRSRIDSAAFERARQTNTEEAYIDFLNDFPTAIQREEAVKLRDEAAYQDAFKVSSYQSFLNFLQKYPQATRAPEAKTQYNKLIFESKTRDKKLSSYTRFLEEFPNTPYRQEVERNIFELFTISGHKQSFQSFIKQFPNSVYARKARSIVFHLELEHEEYHWPPGLLTDSLRYIIAQRDKYLVPVLNDNKYGFMDNTGNLILSTVYQSIDDSYFCGDIQEDLLIADNKVISRTGAVVFKDTVSEVEDLGYGFIRVHTNGCSRVLHKSGFTIYDCIDDARVLGGRYLALKKENGWGLFSLSGRPLTNFEWTEITSADEVLILKNGRGYWPVIDKAVEQLREQSKIGLDLAFDEAKAWPGGFLWVRSGEKQALLDPSLKEVIHLGEQTITSFSFGAVAESSDSTRLFLRTGEVLPFKSVRIQEPWIAVKPDSVWRVLNPEHRSVSSQGYDSIRFEGPFLIGTDTDSITVYFNQNVQRTFANTVQIDFIPGKQTEAFVLVRKGQKGTLFNEKGNPVFATEYDNLQYAGEGFFIVTRQEKKGLLNASGKLVLPIEYDAIGNVLNHTISLLKKMKFGAYNTLQKKLLKPQYDKNVIVYNDKVVAVYQKGVYTFNTWDNKPLNTFEFSEVKRWNDTTALVKQKALWHLYHLNAKKVVIGNIKELQFIKDTPDEVIAIIQQEKSFGVISNTRGFVIPDKFTDIVNLGSAEEPLYFTEKHVEEADIYVVIYYDHEGKLIRRQVFEASDYEKIYCSDN